MLKPGILDNAGKATTRALHSLGFDNVTITNSGTIAGDQTSADGVDASIIQSNGDNEYKLILDRYFKYDQNMVVLYCRIFAALPRQIKNAAKLQVNVN